MGGVDVHPSSGGWTCHPISVWQVSRHVLRVMKTCRVLDALSSEHIFPQRGNTSHSGGGANLRKFLAFAARAK